MVSALGLQPVRGAASHPFLRGVWQPLVDGVERPTTALTRHQWEIDDESPAIEVTDPKDVVTLLESPDLARFAKGRTAVAVTFRPGSRSRLGDARGTGEWGLAKSGRVLHTLSHYGKQAELDQGEALENVLLNFLVEAKQRRELAR